MKEREISSLRGIEPYLIEPEWSSADERTDDVPGQEFNYFEDEPKLSIHNRNQLAGIASKDVCVDLWAILELILFRKSHVRSCSVIMISRTMLACPFWEIRIYTLHIVTSHHSIGSFVAVCWVRCMIFLWREHETIFVYCSVQTNTKKLMKVKLFGTWYSLALSFQFASLSSQ